MSIPLQKLISQESFDTNADWMWCLSIFWCERLKRSKQAESVLCRLPLLSYFCASVGLHGSFLLLLFVMLFLPLAVLLVHNLPILAGQSVSDYVIDNATEWHAFPYRASFLFCVICTKLPSGLESTRADDDGHKPPKKSGWCHRPHVGFASST